MASAQAYDLDKETLEAYPNGGTALRVTRNTHMLSAAADAIRKANHANSFAKPRKSTQSLSSIVKKKGEERKRATATCVRGRPFRQAGLALPDA